MNMTPPKTEDGHTDRTYTEQDQLTGKTQTLFRSLSRYPFISEFSRHFVLEAPHTREGKTDSAL